jgi:predicted nucleic acid-binding protein
MRGDKRLLLDTNAVIALLQGHPFLINEIRSATWVAISIISSLEFLSFSGLTDHDRELFKQFASRIDVVSLNSGNQRLLDQAVELRRQERLRLPDAIVAATAVVSDASLVIADQQLTRIANLRIVPFQP